MNSAEINELNQFLSPDTRLDVKSLALHYVLSLTGTIEGRELIISNDNVINSVVKLAFGEDEQKSIIKDSFFTLINLSSNENDSFQILNKTKILVNKLLDYILNCESKFADVACGVLSNLSRGNLISKMKNNS
jgi:hypothetical protein